MAPGFRHRHRTLSERGDPRLSPRHGLTECPPPPHRIFRCPPIPEGAPDRRQTISPSGQGSAIGQRLRPAFLNWDSWHRWCPCPSPVLRRLGRASWSLWRRQLCRCCKWSLIAPTPGDLPSSTGNYWTFSTVQVTMPHQKARQTRTGRTGWCCETRRVGVKSPSNRSMTYPRRRGLAGHTLKWRTWISLCRRSPRSMPSTVARSLSAPDSFVTGPTTSRNRCGSTPTRPGTRSAYSSPTVRQRNWPRPARRAATHWPPTRGSAATQWSTRRRAGTLLRGSFLLRTVLDVPQPSGPCALGRKTSSIGLSARSGPGKGPGVDAAIDQRVLSPSWLPDALSDSPTHGKLSRGPVTSRWRSVGWRRGSNLVKAEPTWCATAMIASR